LTDWARRDVLKLGVAAPAAAHALGNGAVGKHAHSPSAAATSPVAPGATAAPSASAMSGRERLLMDFGWRFHLGNADDGAQDFDYGKGLAFAKTGQLFAASLPDFDDGDWRRINLPHDWAVELPFVHDSPVERVSRRIFLQFDKSLHHALATVRGNALWQHLGLERDWDAQLSYEDDSSIVGRGSKPIGRVFPDTSIGWYRRVFEIPEADLGRRIFLRFDGVFRDAMVALNGNYLGRNLSGYAPFSFDISDFVEYGSKNVLAVRVDATEKEGWFYEGAGIYRHVWLEKTNPLHVAHDGVFVRSEVGGAGATVRITTEIEDDGDTGGAYEVTSTIFDAEGKEVASAHTAAPNVAQWEPQIVEHQVTIAKPALWSIEEPNLYRLVTAIERGGVAVDSVETSFGIRSIRFDANKGFYLNDKPVRVLGMCNHQDHAGVGSALPDRLQAFRIEKLKGMGANAYRTSHNPPTPELLDACDRLGMLVMDETRMFSSNREGLSQLERLVRRDRNHPSVFLWSIGNEEPEQGTDRGARMARSMKRLVRKLDPTRPITEAMHGDWGKGLSYVVDVQGFNYYTHGNVDQFHAAFPLQPSIGTEESSAYRTRGIYENDKPRGYVSAYDTNAPQWGALAEKWWNYYLARPFVAGAFVWTGFDYRGEPTPYVWPCINSHFGVMDTCGFPKDTYYFYKAWWSGKPVLHLFPHWNWSGKEGREIPVWVYANCEEVELLLNGTSLGRQTVPRDSHLEWKVAYQKGSLVARGFTGGKLIGETKRETTGAPAAIQLSPDRAGIAADGEDISVVEVSVVDSQGRAVPDAANKISFTVSGPGSIIGVGNGDPSCHEPDKASERSVFCGLAQVIVQAWQNAGDITLSASSEGLNSAQAVIHAEATVPRPAVAIV
jgi:beta-galactosidase